MIGDRRLKTGLLLAALLAVGGTVYGFYTWTQQPVRVTPAMQMVPQKRQTVKGTGGIAGEAIPLAKAEAWQAAYFTSELPDSMQLQTTREDTSTAVIGSYMLVSRAARQSDQIGVTVGSLNGSVLNEIAAVRLRVSQPSAYTAVNRDYAPPGSLVYSRADGNYETSVFWSHQDRYVAVVASGSSQRQSELEQALATIIKKWQWK